jgi:hypothetical protein
LTFDLGQKGLAILDIVTFQYQAHKLVEKFIRFSFVAVNVKSRILTITLKSLKRRDKNMVMSTTSSSILTKMAHHLCHQNIHLQLKIAKDKYVVACPIPMHYYSQFQSSINK